MDDDFRMLTIQIDAALSRMASRLELLDSRLEHVEQMLSARLDEVERVQADHEAACAALLRRWCA